jgi:predicted nucleic acid-binding protein
VIVVDTSVAVAAALPWHEAHAAARSAIGVSTLPVVAQVAAETYSVLTRLPPPQRVPPAVARDFIVQTFELPPIGLAPAELGTLLDLAVDKGVTGGAIYDAIVGSTARKAGATLLSLDWRATRTYQLVGADYTLLS